MDRAAPRTSAQRRADTLAKLSEPRADAWVASAPTTAEEPGKAHLVPLSLAWIDGRIVLAVQRTSRTARNIVDSGVARIALGPTRDVVMIDARLERSVPVPDAPAELADGYAGQSDWDPRTDGAAYVYLVLVPDRLQAWRESDELPGRTLMRAGRWVQDAP